MGEGDVPLDRGGLEILDEGTALDLLSAVPLGRVAFPHRDRLPIVPVAHVVRSGQVAMLARPGSSLRTAASHETRCAFEVDAYDPVKRTGWSVVVQGTLDLVSDPGERDALLDGGAGAAADPAGAPSVVCVRADRITGRRIDRTGAPRPRSSLAGAPQVLRQTQPIDPDRSRALLAATPVGRVGFVMHDAPLLMPVNHTVQGRDVVFRTARGSKLDVAQQRAGDGASFQVDAFDPGSNTGWSVLVTGRMHPVLDQMQVGRLERLGVDAWADAVERSRWIRIAPGRVEGSRLGLGGWR